MLVLVMLVGGRLFYGRSCSDPSTGSAVSRWTKKSLAEAIQKNPNSKNSRRKLRFRRSAPVTYTRCREGRNP